MVARRRVDLDSVAADQTTPVDTTRLRLNRELRVVGSNERAVPRATRTRPTAGDFVPELRYDPLTTIAPAIPRRGPRGEERRDTRGGPDATSTRAPEASEAERRQRTGDARAAHQSDGRQLTHDGHVVGVPQPAIRRKTGYPRCERGRPHRRYRPHQGRQPETGFRG